MSATISVAIEKGGAGKTTTVWSLGGWFHSKGYSVLYIDMDGQGTLSRLLNADASKPTIYDVMTGTKQARHAIQSTFQGDLIQGSPQMGDIGAVLTTTGREYRLSEVLDRVPYGYDVVLIDTAPGIGISTICALTASDYVIVPMRADVVTLQGLETVLGSIQSVQRYTNNALEVLGIVITDYDSRPALSRQILEFIQSRAENIPAPVLGTVRHGIAVQEAQGGQVPLQAYAPRSNPAKDTAAIAKDLAGRIGLEE